MKHRRGVHGLTLVIFLALCSLAAVTQINLTTQVKAILPSANGGTGNGFTKFTGPASAEKTFTLHNATSTLASTLAVQTTSVTVANTASETSVLTGTITGNGLALPANTMFAGQVVNWHASSFYSTTGTPNLTVKIKLGTVTLLTVGPTATSSGVSNAQFSLNATCIVRSVGASGTVICGFEMIGIGTLTVRPWSDTATHTIDTTGSNSPDILITWGTASSSNTWTTYIYRQQSL